MANIEEIDYDVLSKYASILAYKGDTIQRKIRAAFNEVKSMGHESWKGKAYDNFVDTVNSSIPSLNKLFETIVSDIPHEIAAKAKSYAAATQDELSIPFTEQTAIILNELEKNQNGSKVKFISDKVESSKSKIETKFEDAKDLIVECRDEVKNLKSYWKSSSGESNITALNTAYTQVENIIDEIKKALDGQISAQIETFNQIEGAADDVVATDKVKGDEATATSTAANTATNNIKSNASNKWQNYTGKK